MEKLALFTPAAALAVAMFGISTAAHAQERAAHAQERAAYAQERAAHAQERTRDTVTVTDSVPNRGLIWSGVAVLGTTYGISTVVATVSDRPADRALWVPIVGPWIDLASRGGCEGPCRHETTNKVLLVASGVGQAVGVLQILGGFLYPAKRTVTTVGHVQIVPMGTGIAARTVF